MSTPRADHATASVGCSLFVMGGINKPNQGGLRAVEFLDCHAEDPRWYKLPDLNTQRWALAALSMPPLAAAEMLARARSYERQRRETMRRALEDAERQPPPGEHAAASREHQPALGSKAASLVRSAPLPPGHPQQIAAAAPVPEEGGGDKTAGGA